MNDGGFVFGLTLMKHFFNFKPSALIYGALSVGIVASFLFLLTQYTLAQFTPPCDTPPNCQPQAGAVTANLLDVLMNGPTTAETFGSVDEPNHKGYIGIGGGKTTGGGSAGEVRLGIGTSTPGFPLDVISQTSGDPDKDTANLRLGYNNPSPVWTGVKLDRKAGDEKWFLGMASSSDNLIIRSDSNTNLVEIPPGKGAACFGAMFRQFTKDPTGTNLTFWPGDVGGYEAANSKCPDTMHVCSLEEMYRTIHCSPVSLKTNETAFTGAAWVNGAPVTVTALSDCRGWTSSSIDDSGTYWGFDASKQTVGTSQTMVCEQNNALPFACCR